MEEISHTDCTPAAGLVEVLAVPLGAVGSLKAPPQPTRKAPKPPKVRVTKAPKPPKLRVTKAPKLRVTET